MNGGGNVSLDTTGTQASGGGMSGGVASTRSEPIGVDTSPNVPSTCSSRLPSASSAPVAVVNVRPRFTTSVVTTAGPGRPGARKWPVTVTGSGRPAHLRIARTATLSR